MKKKFRLLFLLVMFLTGMGWQANAYTLTIDPSGTSDFGTFTGCLEPGFSGTTVPVEITVTLPVDQSAALEMDDFTGTVPLIGMLQVTYSGFIIPEGLSFEDSGTTLTMINAGSVNLEDGIIDGSGIVTFTANLKIDPEVTLGRWNLTVSFGTGIGVFVTPLEISVGSLHIAPEPAPFEILDPNDPNPPLSVCSGERVTIGIFSHGFPDATENSGAQPGIRYKWTIQDPNNLLGRPIGPGTVVMDNTVSLSRILTNTGNTPATITASVTAYNDIPGGGYCEGETKTITYTVNPVPEILGTVVTDYTGICAGNEIVVSIPSIKVNRLAFSNLEAKDFNGDVIDDFELSAIARKISLTPIGATEPVELNDENNFSDTITILPLNNLTRIIIGGDAIPAGATVTFDVTPLYANNDGTICDGASVTITIEMIKVADPEYYVTIGVNPAELMKNYNDTIVVCSGDAVTGSIDVSSILIADQVPEGYIVNVTGDNVGLGIVSIDAPTSSPSYTFTTTNNTGDTPLVGEIEIIPYIIDTNGDKCFGNPDTIVVKVNPVARIVDVINEPITCPDDNEPSTDGDYVFTIISVGADSLVVFGDKSSNALGFPTDRDSKPYDAIYIRFDEDYSEGGITATTIYDNGIYTTTVRVAEANLVPGDKTTYRVFPMGCQMIEGSLTVEVRDAIPVGSFDMANQVLRYKNGDMVNDIWLTPYQTTAPGIKVSWERMLTSDVISGTTDPRDHGINIIPRFTAVNEGETILRAVFKYTVEYTDDPACKFYSKDSLIIEVEPYVIEDERLSMLQIGDISLCEEATLSEDLVFKAVYDNSSVTLSEVKFQWTLVSGDMIFAGKGVQGELVSEVDADSVIFAVKGEILNVGKAVYSVTPVWNNNKGKTVYFNVLVTEKPSITYLSTNGKGTDANVYNPNDLVNIKVEGAPLYSWTGGAGIGLKDGSGLSVPSFAAVNAGTTVSTVTIKVTAVSVNGCEGVDSLVEIIVHPAVVLDIVIKDVEVCSEDNITIDIPEITNTIHEYKLSLLSGTDLSLSVNAVAGEITGSYANNANAPAVAIYSLALVDKVTGSSKAVNFKVTVAPNPKLEDIENIVASNGTLIPAFMFRGNVTNGSYSWEKTAGDAIANLPAKGDGPVFPSFTAVNLGSSVITATYTVSAISSVCDTLEKTFTITVYPDAKIVDQISDSTRCAGDNMEIVLTDQAANKVGYELRFIGGQDVGLSLTGNEISGTLANNTNPKVPVVGTYRVTAVNTETNVKGESVEFRVTVYPKPELDKPNDITTVSGVVIPAFSFTGNVIGGTYSWELTDGDAIANLPAKGEGSVFQSFIAENLTNAIVTATYTVTAKSGNCVAETEEFTITIYPEPKVINNIYDAVYCSGSPFTPVVLDDQSDVDVAYKLNYVSGTNLGLTLNGNTIEVDGDLLNATNSVITAVYSVVPYNTEIGHEGRAKTFTVTVYPKPGLDKPNDITTVSGVVIPAFSFTGNVIGGTYSWERTDGDVIANLPAKGEGSVFQSFTAENLTNAIVTATYTVTAKSGNCDVETEEFTITIYPEPKVINNIYDAVYCSGDPFTPVVLDDQSDVNVAYRLKYVSGTNLGLTLNGNTIEAAGDLINKTNSAITAVYSVVPYNTETKHEGSAKTFTVTVYPVPSVAKVNDITTVHGAAIPGFAFTGNVTGLSYSWKLIEGNLPNLPAAGEGSFPSFIAENLTDGIVTATYEVTTKAGICPAEESQEFTITIYPEPKVKGDVYDVILCNGDAIPFDLSETNEDEAYRLVYISGTNLKLTLTDGSLGSATNTSTGINSAIYSVVPYNKVTGHEGKAKVFVIKVQPDLNRKIHISDMTYCNNESVPRIDFISEVAIADARFVWERSGGNAIGSASSGENFIPAFTAVNSTSNQVLTAEFRVKLVLGECESAWTIFTITVRPDVKLILEYETPAVEQVSFCPGDEMVVLVDIDEEVAIGYDLSFQWYKNEKAITGATGSSFVILNPVKEDEGLYHVVITGDCNFVRSKSYNVFMKQEVLFQRWGTEALVINTDEATNEGYVFTNIKWYSEADPGKVLGNMTYLYQSGGLNAAAKYYFTADTNFGPYESCKMSLKKAPVESGISIYPNPVDGGKEITIEGVSSCVVQVLSDAGAVLSSRAFSASPVKMQMPVASGVYMLSIAREGKPVTTFTVIVK